MLRPCGVTGKWLLRNGESFRLCNGPTMKVTTVRWILDPLNAWRARQLVKATGGKMAYETAWRLARLHHHIDELPYASAAARLADRAGRPDASENTRHPDGKRGDRS